MSGDGLDDAIRTIEAGGTVTVRLPYGCVQELGASHLDDLYLARDVQRFLADAGARIDAWLREEQATAGVP